MSETPKLHTFTSKLYTFYAKTPHLESCLHVARNRLASRCRGGEKAGGVMDLTAVGSPLRSHW